MFICVMGKFLPVYLRWRDMTLQISCYGNFFIALEVKKNNRVVFMAFLFVCFLTLCLVTSHTRIPEVTQWHGLSKIFVHGKKLYQTATKLNFNPLSLRGTSENGLQKGLFCVTCILFVPFLSYMRQHAKNVISNIHALSYIKLLNQPKCTLNPNTFIFWHWLHEVMEKRGQMHIWHAWRTSHARRKLDLSRLAFEPFCMYYSIILITRRLGKTRKIFRNIELLEELTKVKITSNAFDLARILRCKGSSCWDFNQHVASHS